MEDRAGFGSRRIYYNNFADHLFNAYNPNMLYPELPHRWSDRDWFGLIDMIAGFGFTAFEFWLVPGLFCRQGLESAAGRAFTRQINAVVEHAHTRGLEAIWLAALTTSGPDWRTLCPGVPAEWAEVRHLWQAWADLLPEVDVVAIFPGDPGGCSRNGCTAETFIDRSADVAGDLKRKLPRVEIELGTWGSPFWGWGNIQGPPGWQGEFIPEIQHTAWAFDRQRAERSMHHLLRRLPDFPDPTCVSINLGFNGDSNPDGEANAIPWAQAIARTHRIQTWDFSLTEGENAILPHYRFERLFAQRRRERQAAPYSGGICFTMTPLLNQLSLYEAARSFVDPDGDPGRLAEGFYERLFGPQGREVVPLLPLFEVVPDWGNYHRLQLPRAEFHLRMQQLAACLADLRSEVRESMPFHPSVEAYRQELGFHASLLADLSAPAPDYDAVRRRYWERVYRIYDHLPAHVDPRPHQATDRLVRYFAERPEATAMLGTAG